MTVEEIDESVANLQRAVNYLHVIINDISFMYSDQSTLPELQTPTLIFVYFDHIEFISSSEHYYSLRCST